MEGPLLAGLRVVTPERGGTIRESMAMRQAYAEARQQHGHSELLDEIVTDPPPIDPSRFSGGGGDVATAADSGPA